MKNSYKFFMNKECRYFPCHDTGNLADFNCLFCYCPLYTLGDKCGGNFKYRENKVKDCSGCDLPHRPESYEYILSKFEELARLASRGVD